MTKVSGTLDIFYLQDMSGTEAAKNKAAYTREGRRQLFALLQGARGSTGNLFFPVVILMFILMRLVEMGTLVNIGQNTAKYQAAYAQ
jgi:membrane-bound metal-dependent hydrolase YbcI (DUF457 family)